MALVPGFLDKFLGFKKNSSGDLNVPECPRQVLKLSWKGFVGGNVLNMPWVHHQDLETFWWWPKVFGFLNISGLGS